MEVAVNISECQRVRDRGSYVQNLSLAVECSIKTLVWVAVSVFGRSWFGGMMFQRLVPNLPLDV